MKLHFVASENASAPEAAERLMARYGQAPLEQAEVIVALGGDGFMLRALHRHATVGLPVYGMKKGTVGFLMNRFSEDDLLERIQTAECVSLNPLRMQAVTESGGEVSGLAVNEVSLLRQTNQAAKIRITINGAVKVEELVCDGVLLATAAGSTAYNFSAHGPILPLGTEALALTPISPFRPRRFRGAILPSAAEVEFRILEPYKRPVSATADAFEVRNVLQVNISLDRNITHQLMFDEEHSLEQRILDEQFLS